MRSKKEYIWIYHKEIIKSDSFYWGKKYKNKLLFFWADFTEDWTLLISSCLCHTLTYLRRKSNRSCARTQMEVRYIRSKEKKLCFFKQHAIKQSQIFTFCSGMSQLLWLSSQNSKGICNVIWQQETKCFTPRDDDSSMPDWKRSEPS